MRGPAAPKDPEKARPYFYIIKEKDIFFVDNSAVIKSQKHNKLYAK